MCTENSIAENSIFTVSLNYLIVPRPDFAVMNDQADILAGMIANMQNFQTLCVVKQSLHRNKPHIEIERSLSFEE